MLDTRFKACILAGRCGSISDAANSLYLSKQAVKKQIDSLEQELGFKIFCRSSKGLELTETGRMYIEGIEKLTAQYSQLVSRCLSSDKHGKQQVLTILQPNHPKLYFKETLTEYNEKFPNVVINVINTQQLLVLYNNTARLKALSDGKADVIFAPHENRFDEANLDYIKICNLPFYCVLKRGHELSRQKYITREDLAGYSVMINTVIDREVYNHIVDQDVPFLPERILYAENEPSNILSVMSFCMNEGIFITKGDYIDTLDPLIAIPLKPLFLVENGIYYRKDAPEHVKKFIDMVCQRPWRYSVENTSLGKVFEQV